MSYTIALCLQKGGTGKTTTTLNLGVELAQLGARVLLVDIDPQANLTTGLGFELNTFEFTIYDILHNRQMGAKFAIQPVTTNIDLIPSTLLLAGAEMDFANKIGRELILKKALATVKNSYDYILIDTPPSLGFFTVNALVAADSVLVPLQAHIYAFQAMPHLEAIVDLVRELNPKLAIDSILLTLVDRRTGLSNTIEKQARETYGDKVFKTVIPSTIRVAESPAAGEPMRVYAPENPAAKAYQDLAWEVKGRFDSHA
jgi:chromosome partitioning protein